MMQLMRARQRFSLFSCAIVARTDRPQRYCPKITVLGSFVGRRHSVLNEIGCPMAPNSHCNGQFGRPLNHPSASQMAAGDRLLGTGHVARGGPRPKVTLRPIGGPKRDRGLDGRNSAHRAAICRGEGLGFVEAGEPFPVLQQLVEAEAGAAQRRRRVAAGGGGKSEHDCLLAFLGEPGLASKGASSRRRPLPDLLGIAVEGVGFERGEAG